MIVCIATLGLQEIYAWFLYLFTIVSLEVLDAVLNDVE